MGDNDIAWLIEEKENKEQALRCDEAEVEKIGYGICIYMWVCPRMVIMVPSAYKREMFVRDSIWKIESDRFDLFYIWVIATTTTTICSAQLTAQHINSLFLYIRLLKCIDIFSL